MVVLKMDLISLYDGSCLLIYLTWCKVIQFIYNLLFSFPRSDVCLCVNKFNKPNLTRFPIPDRVG